MFSVSKVKGQVDGFWCWMLECMKYISNVLCNGYVYISVSVIPSERDSTIQGTFPIYWNRVVMFLNVDRRLSECSFPVYLTPKSSTMSVKIIGIHFCFQRTTVCLHGKYPSVSKDSFNWLFF